MVDYHIYHECRTKTEDGIESDTDDKIFFIRKLISTGVLRFAGWWSVFAGLLAFNSVCPVCGNTACPVGLGTTGIIAAFFASLRQWGGSLFGALSDRIRSFRGRRQ